MAAATASSPQPPLRAFVRVSPDVVRRLDQDHAERSDFRAIGRVIAPGRRIGDQRFETEGAWKRSVRPWTAWHGNSSLRWNIRKGRGSEEKQEGTHTSRPATPAWLPQRLRRSAVNHRPTPRVGQRVCRSICLENLTYSPDQVSTVWQELQGIADRHADRPEC